jgi:hypothetical protein
MIIYKIFFLILILKINVKASKRLKLISNSKISGLYSLYTLRTCLAPVAHACRHSYGCTVSAVDESSATHLASCGVKNELERVVAAKTSASCSVGVCTCGTASYGVLWR